MVLCSLIMNTDCVLNEILTCNDWKKTGRRTDCIGSNSPPAAVTLVSIHAWPDHIQKIKRGVQRNRISFAKFPFEKAKIERFPPNE